MCIADWQLGRLIRALPPRFVSLTTSPAVIATANKNRVGITICNTATAQVDVMPELDAAADIGFNIFKADASAVGIDTLTITRSVFLHITLKDYGDLPTRRWSGVASAPTEITVIEYILPEDILSLTPEELRKRSR